ncbi:hypothetical protein BDZ97DRAFT_2078966 [Flammula alnicola]|nr:hypothetical protein BDZ97DRAFT_2078966 [Flammula alnicola]
MSAKVSLSTLIAVLTAHPEVQEHLDIDGCFKFIELIQLLKPTLSLHQPPGTAEHLPLERLPASVLDFFKRCLSLEHDNAKIVWEALAPIAWNLGAPEDIQAFGRRYLQFFLDNGRALGLAFYHFMPPIRLCLDPGCNSKSRTAKQAGVPYSRELAEKISVPVTAFTQDFGPIPALSTSLYCRECNTRYYADYWVNKEKSTRTYYQTPSNFIQTGQHVFIEKRTLELFTMMMLKSWTSAGNCARIYNTGLALKSLSPSLSVSFVESEHVALDVEDVWDGLLLYWVLEDAQEREEVLELVHDAPSQAKRLQPALHARNLRMAGPGQEAWNHACEVQSWDWKKTATRPDWTAKRPDQQSGLLIFENQRPQKDRPDLSLQIGPKGIQIVYVRSTVTDGVGIGRPTCGVHDCDIPLELVKDQFCPTHADQDLICVVTACSEYADEGHRTCSLKEHRELENYNSEKNKAMFQLRERLARLRTSQPRESIPVAGDDIGLDEEVLVDNNGICDGKPEEGNQTLRARFGRKRTHNEELCVTSCGVILGRATFYGSEAPNGVVSFWKKLFPTRRSLPSVLWHDNNCRIVAMLDNPDHPDTYFEYSALPVDVFHFKCKHKASDEKCNDRCNPVNWPELCTREGTWRFNSSAAEQANAWIGGYQAIVREMQADRYEFFLDEMIKRRNCNIIKDLEKKGKEIYPIPRETLLRPETPEIVVPPVGVSDPLLQPKSFESESTSLDKGRDIRAGGVKEVSSTLLSELDEDQKGALAGNAWRPSPPLARGSFERVPWGESPLPDLLEEATGRSS